MHDHATDQSDEALVRRVLGGEREAFTPLALRHYASMLRLCRQLLGSAHDAQDVAQEAALQAFLGLARLNEPARFGAWLHSIAANLARSVLRRRRLASLDQLPAGLAVRDLWPAPYQQPDDHVAAREVHDAIMAAIERLPQVNRRAVVGFYLESLSYAELAELLDVPVSTVKGRLFHGRQELRQALGPLAGDVLRPDRRARKEARMSTPSRREATIAAVYNHEQAKTGYHVVVLRESAGRRYLPIWIGGFEADAIRRAQRGEQTQRPMTHDLTLRLLEPLGAQIQGVVVGKILEQTYYAEIMLAHGGQDYSVDARPSDALALAARAGTRIYIEPAVLDQEGLTVEALAGDAQPLPGGPPASLEEAVQWLAQATQAAFVALSGADGQVLASVGAASLDQVHFMSLGDIFAAADERAQVEGAPAPGLIVQRGVSHALCSMLVGPGYVLTVVCALDADLALVRRQVLGAAQGLAPLLPAAS